MKSDHPNSYLHHFAAVLVLVSSLCVLCGKTSAQDFRTVHPGVEYAIVHHRIGSDPVKITLLRLDLTKVRLDVHHALDAAIGVEKTSSIAVRHNALAAINAGFFRLDNSMFAGDAAGILKVDRVVLSEPSRNRVAIFIENRAAKTEVEFGHLATRNWIEVKKRTILVDGSNRERKENELVEYYRSFHRTTLTDPSGIEVLVRNGRVAEIRDGSGSSPIPIDGYVLSASGTKRDEIRRWVKVGTKVNGYTAVEGGSITENRHVPYGFEDITNGVPQLIKNGTIEITWEKEKASKSFVEMRHPRTAVAKLKDGKFLMITVDGRQPGVSVGMNLQELADYLLTLGAVDAMNLDGGGSTTMFLDGKVVNTPSDKEGERKVGDAILVTLRKNTRR